MPGRAFRRLPGLAEDEAVDLPSPLSQPDDEPPKPPEVGNLVGLKPAAPRKQYSGGGGGGNSQVEKHFGGDWSEEVHSFYAPWQELMQEEFAKQERRLDQLLRSQEGRLLGAIQKMLEATPPSTQRASSSVQPFVFPNRYSGSGRPFQSVMASNSGPTSSNPLRAWAGRAASEGGSKSDLHSGAKSATAKPPQRGTQHGRSSKRAMVALARHHTNEYNEAIEKMHNGEGSGVGVDHRTTSGTDDDRLDEGRRCSFGYAWTKKVVESRRFELMVTSLIIVNAFFIGFQTDWAIQHIDEELPWSLRAFNIFFTLFFAVELGMRIFVERLYFAQSANPQCWWNFLDTVIVCAAIGEEICNFLAIEAGNLSVMRLLRVLRVARFVRFFRVMRFFRDLRVMLHGIMGSLRALLWCMLLLLLVMYMFAVLVIQVVKLELESLHDQRKEEGWVTNLDLESRQNDLKDHFGSMLLCLYSLFKCVMGGVDWGELAEMLRQISPIWLVPFTLYISFAMLCVLNVVTGVFVENANKLTAQDQDHVIMEELAARKAWFEEVKRIFHHADVDGSGFVDFAEFKAVISDPRVKMIFRKVGIDVETISPQGLFNMFAYEHPDFISIEEFVVGVQQFHGHARALDVAKVLHLVKQQRAQQSVELSYLGGMCDRGLEKQAALEQSVSELAAALVRKADGGRGGGSGVAMGKRSSRGQGSGTPSHIGTVVAEVRSSEDYNDDLDEFAV